MFRGWQLLKTINWYICSFTQHLAARLFSNLLVASLISIEVTDFLWPEFENVKGIYHFYTVRQGNSKCKKTSQSFSRLPWECPEWELQNEPPLDRSGLTPQIPFMASLWIRSGYDMKVAMSAETYQVGAHFKALIKAILVAPLKSFERFFRISSFPAGLCLAKPPSALFISGNGATGLQSVQIIILHFFRFHVPYC